VPYAGNEYVLHINFEEIDAELERLTNVDQQVMQAIVSFVDSLRKTTFRIEPTLSKETEDEKVLWEDYRKLQREKLAVLDLSHEWDYLSQTVKEAHPKLDFLVNDAIEELKEHISVLAESHRAHIDILEIYNTRKITVLALVLTVIISYLAVWEFFVRDLVVGIKFPGELSPSLNYSLIIITLLPVFAVTAWAWIRRKTYF
jgi:hypothetical protein